MDNAVFEAVTRDWSREEWAQYVTSLLWQYRLVDAFWFLKVEDAHGLEAAEARNAEVWEKVSALSARDIKKRFGPFPPGVDGFLAAYRLFPWSLMVDYQVDRVNEHAVEVRVPRCPAQEGRAKHGLGPYHCRDMHLGEFRAFAREIDPGVRVACLHAPPDSPAGGPDCAWRFFTEPRQES